MKDPSADDVWLGRLELVFEAGQGRPATRLASRRHIGPLRLLKPLASEDGCRLEAVIVHPPGGLVAGDVLELEVQARAGSAVLLTTPGAQKWYRAARGEAAPSARMETRLDLEAGAELDWLPQPSILFDGARASQSLTLAMAATASSIGWEMIVRGRAAMGEQWRSGRIDQSLTIVVDGRPAWSQHLHAAADDRLFESPLGWRGARIAASIWCCAPDWSPETLEGLRDRWRALIDAGGGVGGASLLEGGLLIAQLLGDEVETLQNLAVALWQAGRSSGAASLPRIWRT